MADVYVGLTNEYQSTRGIARSTDQGQNWTQVYTASSNVVSVCNTPTGYAAITYDGHLLTSTNGTSWTDEGQIDANATTCEDIEYIGNDTLVVANGTGGGGGNPTAFISTDNGSSWSTELSHPSCIFRIVKMGSVLNGEALMLGYTDASPDTRYVTKTTDFGATWTPVGTVSGNVKDVDAVYLGSGVVLACGQDAVTSEGTIFKSYDYGNDWTSVFTLSGYQANSIGWLQDTTVAFCSMFLGDGGNPTRRLYKSSDNGSTFPTLVGTPGATALYGDSSGNLYSGRTSTLCPVAAASSIAVSDDQGATFAYVTTQYAPTRFVMEEDIPAPPTYTPTRLDYRFVKWATNPGFEEVGDHEIRAKAGTGITLGATGLSVDYASIDEMYITQHTVTAADVTSKSITLSTAMADTDQLSLVVMGGSSQNYGTDYTAADSTTVDWNGLGLEGVIAENDVVRLQYPK